MKEKVIVFNKTGYDPFIDFIKAYAIVCVLLGHTFPYLNETGYFLWYGMQVPLFVLIQVFHAFKKDKPSIDFKKIAIRIVIPYVLVQLFLFVILLNFGENEHNLLYRFLANGGMGPGSYYPWIYLQFALLLPIIKKWFDRGNESQKIIFAIAICEGLEILPSLIHLSDGIYRLLAIRYFFLVYLGWIWVHDGIVLNKKTLFLSFISILTIIYFSYFYLNCEPLFFDTAWRAHRWPCYYYVAVLLSYILYVLYKKTRHLRGVDFLTRMLARCSYEIFLIQMAAVLLCPSLNFISNIYVRVASRIILIWILSIGGGYYFNIIYNKLTQSLIRTK